MSQRAESIDLENPLGTSPSDMSTGEGKEVPTLYSHALRSCAYTALQAPLNGVTQLYDRTFDTEHLPKVQVIDPCKPVEFASAAWHAQQLGAGLGLAYDFMLGSAATGAMAKSIASRAGFAATAAAESAALASELGSATRLVEHGTLKSVGNHALTGFVYDGVFREVQDKDKDGFWSKRFNNAIVGASTFATLTLAGTVPIVRDLTPLARGVISGAPAGIVNSNLASLLDGKGLASAKDQATNAYGFMFVGGAMSALGSTAEQRNKIANETIAEAQGEILPEKPGGSLQESEVPLVSNDVSISEIEGSPVSNEAPISEAEIRPVKTEAPEIQDPQPQKSDQKTPEHKPQPPLKETQTSEATPDRNHPAPLISERKPRPEGRTKQSNVEKLDSERIAREWPADCPRNFAKTNKYQELILHGQKYQLDETHSTTVFKTAEEAQGHADYYKEYLSRILQTVKIETTAYQRADKTWVSAMQFDAVGWETENGILAISESGEPGLMVAKRDKTGLFVPLDRYEKTAVDDSGKLYVVYSDGKVYVRSPKSGPLSVRDSIRFSPTDPGKNWQGLHEVSVTPFVGAYPILGGEPHKPSRSNSYESGKKYEDAFLYKERFWRKPQITGSRIEQVVQKPYYELPYPFSTVFPTIYPFGGSGYRDGYENRYSDNENAFWDGTHLKYFKSKK